MGQAVAGGIMDSSDDRIVIENVNVPGSTTP